MLLWYHTCCSRCTRCFLKAGVTTQSCLSSRSSRLVHAQLGDLLLTRTAWDLNRQAVLPGFCIILPAVTFESMHIQKHTQWGSRGGWGTFQPLAHRLGLFPPSLFPPSGNRRSVFQRAVSPCAPAIYWPDAHIFMVAAGALLHSIPLSPGLWGRASLSNWRIPKCS